MYTDTLQDKTIVPLVRGIDLASCATFVSPLFAQEPAGSLTFFRAFKNQASGAWTVQEMTALAKTDDEHAYVVSSKNVVVGACFFDALYDVAKRAHVQNGMGKLKTDDAAVLDALGLAGVPDYEAVARHACQPLDMTGLPIPAAGGHILVEGMFDSRALQLAAQGVRLPVRVENRDVFSLGDALGVNEAKGRALAPTAAPMAIELKAKFTRADSRRTELVDYIEGQIQGAPEKRFFGNEYENDAFMPVMLSMFASLPFVFGELGIATLLALPKAAGMGMAMTTLFGSLPIGYSLSRPLTHFRLKKLKYMFAMRALPDGAVKECMRANLTLADAVYKLERAVANFARYQDNNAKPKYFNAAVKDVRKGLAMMGFGADDIERTVAQMHAGCFVEQGFFLKKLQADNAEIATLGHVVGPVLPKP